MKRFYTKGISDQEAGFLKYIEEDGKTLFSTKEIKESRQFKNWSNILLNLKRKGWITQLEKGTYILNSSEVDSFLIGTKLIKPSAVAYFSALNHYGLTEQISNIIYVQTIKRKKSREILNVRYQFVTVSTHKFFGTGKEWLGPDYYLITDMEKTIVDCFDMPQNAGGFPEIIKGFFLSHEKLDKEKLWQYALQLGNITVIKRIGYLSELFELKDYEDFRFKAQKILLQTYTVLDPMSPPRGRYLRRWRLQLNHSENEIIAMAKTIY